MRLAQIATCKVFREIAHRVDQLSCTGLQRRHESTNPELGAVVNRVFGQVSDGMPVAVGMGARHYSYVPTTATGYWSDTYRPPTVDKGLNTGISIDSSRLHDRKQLLDSIDLFRRKVDSGSLQAADSFQRQAFDISSGSKARDAFDITASLSSSRASSRPRDSPAT